MARNANGGFWTKTKIIWFSILGLVLIVGLSIGIPIAKDAINSTTAPITSKLQEKSQVFTAQNRINQYNKFYDEYGTYQDDLEAVKTNVSALNAFNKSYSPAMISADTTGALQQTFGEDSQAVTGARQICVQAANQFNQDSRKVQTGAIFKGLNLSKTVNIQSCQQGSNL
jgi:hypothetical protein